MRTIGRGSLIAAAGALLLSACSSSGATTSGATSSHETSTPIASQTASVSSFPIPNGTYKATPTCQEELAKGFTNKELHHACGPNGTLPPYVLVFDNGTYHDVVEGLDGVKQVGDLGTYTATEKLLILTSETPGCPCTATYRWSFDGKVLSLKLLSDSTGPADFRNVRMVTEHDYVKAG
jgi:hypothetical protein